MENYHGRFYFIMSAFLAVMGSSLISWWGAADKYWYLTARPEIVLAGVIVLIGAGVMGFSWLKRYRYHFHTAPARDTEACGWWLALSLVLGLSAGMAITMWPNNMNTSPFALMMVTLAAYILFFCGLWYFSNRHQRPVPMRR